MTINASVHRNTRFEIREIHQGPNSFGLVCTERGSSGRLPPLEVHEGDFSDEEMRQVHAVLEMLEQKFAPVYDAHVSEPERLRELLVEAKVAEQRAQAANLEAQRVELETVAKRAEAAQLAQDLDAMRAAAAQEADAKRAASESELEVLEHQRTALVELKAQAEADAKRALDELAELEARKQAVAKPPAKGDPP